MKSLRISYLLFGAQAAIAYGSRRLTGDIDLLILIAGQDKLKLIRKLRQKGFHIEEHALENKERFNSLIELFGSAKEGIVYFDLLAAYPEYFQKLYQRRRITNLPGAGNVPMISPEDLVIAKLISFRERSDIPDILDVIRSQRDSLDWRYIRDEAVRCGVLRKLKKIVREAKLQNK